MYEGESLFTRHRHKAPVAMYVTLLDKIDRAVNGEKYLRTQSGLLLITDLKLIDLYPSNGLADCHIKRSACSFMPDSKPNTSTYCFANT